MLDCEVVANTARMWSDGSVVTGDRPITSSGGRALPQFVTYRSGRQSFTFTAETNQHPYAPGPFRLLPLDAPVVRSRVRTTLPGVPPRGRTIR